jgi:hypothetical protein
MCDFEHDLKETVLRNEGLNEVRWFIDGLGPTKFS